MKETQSLFSHPRLVNVDAVGKINDLKHAKSLLDVAETADRAHCWARPGPAAVRCGGGRRPQSRPWISHRSMGVIQKQPDFTVWVLLRASQAAKSKVQRSTCVASHRVKLQLLA